LLAVAVFAFNLSTPAQRAAQTKVPPTRPVAVQAQPYSEAGTLFPYVKNQEHPDYNREILQPLHTAQAKKQAELEAARKAAAEAEASQKAIEAVRTAQAKKAAPTTPLAPKPVITTPEPSPVVASGPTGGVADIIAYWANQYGVSPAWMLSIARCESTLNPSASNGTHFGLYQYLPTTWVEYSTAAGVGGSSIWDAAAQARTTAWALSTGHASAWECK
jgi:soluble lytic murein transglycosylase-like protein